MRFVFLLVLLSGCATFDAHDWSQSAFDNPLDYAAYYTPKGNCLDFAKAVQAEVGGTIYAIEHYPLDHAVVCLDSVCVDNGYLSPGYFDRTDLDHYKIIGVVDGLY